MTHTTSSRRLLVRTLALVALLAPIPALTSSQSSPWRADADSSTSTLLHEESFGSGVPHRWRPLGRTRLGTGAGSDESQAMRVMTSRSDRGRVRSQPPRTGDLRRGAVYVVRAAGRAASRPLDVVVRVREMRGRRVVATSQRRVRLTSSWQPIAVRHRARKAGTRLVLTYAGRRSGQGFSLDRVSVRRQARTASAPSTTLPGGRSGALQLGTQFHGMWQSYTDAERAKTLDKLVAMGATWVRLDVSWEMLQPDGPSSYDTRWGVPFTDRVIQMAHDRGLKVLATLWLTPQWARGSGGSLRSAPADPADYARALAWAAKRWDGKVRAWEVWNEPNSKDFFTSEDPVQYTRLLCAANRSVKSGGTGVPVVFGGTVHNDSAWIRRAYDAGAKGCFDVMATHPYVGPADAGPDAGDGSEIWEFGHLAEVRKLMLARGDAKPIWATEFGWSSHANTGGEQSWNLGVTEAQQARFTVRALELFRTEHPYVTHAFVYNERDKETGDRHQDSYGLLRSDLRTKPVYDALQDYLTRR